MIKITRINEEVVMLKYYVDNNKVTLGNMRVLPAYVVDRILNKEKP